MPLSKWRHSGCVSGQWKQGGKLSIWFFMCCMANKSPALGCCIYTRRNTDGLRSYKLLLFNQTHDKMKNSDVMVAATVGALAGAALGLLFAPRCGKKTRAAICEYMRRHCRPCKCDEQECCECDQATDNDED